MQVEAEPTIACPKVFRSPCALAARSKRAYTAPTPASRPVMAGTEPQCCRPPLGTSDTPKHQVKNTAPGYDSTVSYCLAKEPPALGTDRQFFMLGETKQIWMNRKSFGKELFCRPGVSVCLAILPSELHGSMQSHNLYGESEPFLNTKTQK